ncbi:NAD(P)-dependent oxidoreductase [Acetobacter sacchari]|uniref:NAD(P)-dependent oxidoreductase n=1 Tax=Acetobacter sacchari TaxID=2661687 RepID=A0ABS3LVK0_9PROT|nr:NAD(P)-dependent oxidoreductase [Acetobacter sacchari]MBO1359934.1 NAD(P)-dependent oxidoreductase [Acetobacter sacchari]
MDRGPDIAAGRVSREILALNFADAHPPLTDAQAVIEADRCYFCYDAPCIEACPTGIDVPTFIKGIATGNLAGAARTILESNILGGSCARVCPTEILCEQKCVRNAQEEKPVQIGALQRRATDWQMAKGVQPFTRAAATGRRVAVVGAGPAGLACAHRLAVHGHEVTLFDAKPKPGGLNEYGVAAYKTPGDFAQDEVNFVLSVGGVTLAPDQALGRDFTIDTLLNDHEAVFLSLGQAGARKAGLTGEDLSGVMNAVDFIESIRTSGTKEDVAVGRRVVVVGGGNTAIDAAVQAKRLGAEEVTLVYRRGRETMSATEVEQAWAQTNGVTIRHWAAPERIEGVGGAASAIAFTRGRVLDGRAVHDGEEFVLEADMILKAVGQHVVFDPLEGSGVETEGGRIRVDAFGRTSRPRVYAGGDCTAGEDLTVAAVRDGRDAAEAIHADLTKKKEV